jgi:hypothetical protein
MGEIKLTDREKQVYEALRDHPLCSSQIARAANITTSSPSETAAHFCIKLVKKGLAEKCGTRMFPEWKRLPSPPSSSTLSEGA